MPKTDSEIAEKIVSQLGFYMRRAALREAERVRGDEDRIVDGLSSDLADWLWTQFWADHPMNHDNEALVPMGDTDLLDWAQAHPEDAIDAISHIWSTAKAGFGRFDIRSAIKNARAKRGES